VQPPEGTTGQETNTRMEKEQSTITTKAQAAALKAFPAPYFIHDRCVFRMGYEQAEKDLALTWEDMMRIDEIITQVFKESKTCQAEVIYQEVLKRFKAIKDAKVNV
jgi:hypothetical protein